MIYIDAMFDEGVDGFFNRIAFTSRSTFGDEEYMELDLGADEENEGIVRLFDVTRRERGRKRQTIRVPSNKKIDDVNDKEFKAMFRLSRDKNFMIFMKVFYNLLVRMSIRNQ